MELSKILPGTPVVFGRDGDLTKAVVVKLNRRNASVRILEPRGTHPAGCLFTVSPGALTKGRHKVPSATSQADMARNVHIETMRDYMRKHGITKRDL